MRKLLTLTLAFVVLSSAASATLTRTLTLGHSNNILKDDGNIWLYPSTMFDYPDMAIGEFEVAEMMVAKQPPNGKYSDREFTKLGIHYKFGEDNPFVIGAYFSTVQPYPDFPWWMTSYYYGYFPNNHRIDLFLARKLGENKAGFHFRYLQGSSKYESDIENDPDTYPNQEELATSGYFFNFGLTMMEDKLDLAAGIAFLSWTDVYYQNGYDRTKPDGNMILHLRGRYWNEMNQKFTVIPHAEINYEKYGNKQYNYTDPNEDNRTKVLGQRENKRTTIDFGLGMNYTPAARILAIGDIGIVLFTDNDKYKQWNVNDSLIMENEYKYSHTYLPYIKIGLEGEIFKWLDARLGAASYWRKYTSEENYGQGGDDNAAYTRKYSSNYPFNSSYVGLGFHWGNFYIDTYMDPAIMVDGFEFLRGSNQSYEEYWYYETRKLNYNVTLRYDML